MSDWEKLDEHLHGKKEVEEPKAANEWDKLDEHINEKTTEANTQDVMVVCGETQIALRKPGYTDANIDYAEVFLNGVLLYDSRTFKTGDILTVIVHGGEEEDDE